MAFQSTTAGFSFVFYNGGISEMAMDSLGGTANWGVTLHGPFQCLQGTRAVKSYSNGHFASEGVFDERLCTRV